MPVPSADLAQIFEPIREDLEAVEQEFVRHIQSRVALIPEMGRYIQKSGGKRVRPAVLLMASRLGGYTGRPRRAVCVGRRVHPHGDARPRRHHRRRRSAARPAGRALALGQRHHRAARRLSVHQVDGDGAHAGLAGDHPAALRRHAADDRRGAVSAHEDRRRRHQRGRAFRDHPAQDGIPVRRVRADRRHARRRDARAGDRAARLRLQSRRRLPARRRSARLHGGRGSARQADRRRPARRQGHAADHLPAAARRRGGRTH